MARRNFGELDVAFAEINDPYKPSPMVSFKGIPGFIPSFLAENQQVFHLGKNIFLFSPVVFKGNRFHYWTYFLFLVFPFLGTKTQMGPQQGSDGFRGLQNR